MFLQAKLVKLNLRIIPLFLSKSKIKELPYFSRLQCRTKKRNSLLGGHKTPDTHIYLEYCWGRVITTKYRFRGFPVVRQIVVENFRMLRVVN